jgi:tetratricopeptide (TPR) repeat protein
MKNMRIKLFSTLIYFLYCAYSSSCFFAQTKEQKIDSLKNIIETSNIDTIIVKAYIEWDNLIYNSDPQLDLELNFKVSEICASKLNNTSQITKNEISFYKKYQGSAFNNLAVIFKNKGDFETALDYNYKSLKIKEEINDQKGIANTFINIGTVYHIQGNLVKALENYFQCLKIREELNDQKGIAGIYNNIGAVYHYQKDYMNALTFYKKSLSIRAEIGDVLGSASNFSNVGYVYFEQGDSAFKEGNSIFAYKKYDEALANYKESLKIYTENSSKSNIGMALNNIGTVYFKKKNYDVALKYFSESVLIKKELNEKQGLASSYSNIANIYFESSQFDKAKNFGESAYKLAHESNSIIEINSSTAILHKVYKAMNQQGLALKMYEEFITTRDSISSKESSTYTIQQHFKYEYDKKVTADSIIKIEEIKVKNAEIAAQKAESSKQKLEVEYQKKQKYYLFAGLTIVVLFGLFLFNRLQVIKRQKKLIVEQRNKVELQKNQIEETHKEISDSIFYAKRLQLAILPSTDELNKTLGDGFVIFMPKDVVSGDFYWLQVSSTLNQETNEEEQVVFFAAADCTGHGVPGAMVSVICNNALNRSVREYGITTPGKILDKTKTIVIQEFEKSIDDVLDGMDISLVAIHNRISNELGKKVIELQWAGAYNPLWIIRKNENDSNELIEYKGDKQPVGKYDMPKPFTNHTIPVSEGDVLYIFTDGYVDQFGGEKNKKFLTSNLKKLILSIQHLSMNEQKIALTNEFHKWRGDKEQVDDICIIGVRL